MLSNSYAWISLYIRKKSISNKIAKENFLNTKYQNRAITYQEFHGWNRFELRIQGTSKYDYLGGFKIEVELILLEWKSTFYTQKTHKLSSAGELTYGLTSCVHCPALQFALKNFEYKLKLFDIHTAWTQKEVILLWQVLQSNMESNKTEQGASHWNVQK